MIIACKAKIYYTFFNQKIKSWANNESVIYVENILFVVLTHRMEEKELAAYYDDLKTTAPRGGRVFSLFSGVF